VGPVTQTAKRVGTWLRLDLKVHVPQQVGETDQQTRDRAADEAVEFVSEKFADYVVRGVAFEGEVDIGGKIQTVKIGGDD
jgi:hypothetical protein